MFTIRGRCSAHHEGVTCPAREANLQRSVILRILTEKDTKGCSYLSASLRQRDGGLGFLSPRVLDGEEPFPSTIFFVGMEEAVLESLNTFGT